LCQNVHFDLSAVGQLLHRVSVLRVVLKQDRHLEGGCLQSVSVFEAVGYQFSFRQLIQPSQFPAAVTAGVKGRESLVTTLQLRRQGKRARLLEGPRPGAQHLNTEIH